MPFVLSSIIKTSNPGMWMEGNPYSVETIYDIMADDPRLPPVNYGSHTLKPHSIPHIDAPAHIIPNGKTSDAYFSGGRESCFYGPALVVRLQGESWQSVPGQDSLRLWRVTRDELKAGIIRAGGVDQIPEKLFLTADSVPLNEFGMHDPNYILVLDPNAARYLTSFDKFNAYGTSWKSSDFEPGSRERPVHKILLEQALLFECLKLDHVPEGRYFLSAFALPLEGSSESPVTPVLYSAEELAAGLAALG